MELYGPAGKVVTAVLARRGGVRDMVYNAGVPSKSIGALSALVHQTLKYEEALHAVAKQAQRPSITSLLESNHGLGLVLLYECLFSRYNIRGREPAIATIKSNKEGLVQALKVVMQKRGVTKKEQLLPAKHQGQQVPMPRYARVNMAVTSTHAVQQALQASFPQHKWLSPPESSALPKRCCHADAAVMGFDPLLPDVLVLPAGTRMYDHSLVKSGAVILQDRASCLSAHALAPQAGWSVVDACAAPGNKTTHVASLLAHAAGLNGNSTGTDHEDNGKNKKMMKNKSNKKKMKHGQEAEEKAEEEAVGTVYGFDRSANRAKTLQKMVDRAQCSKRIVVTHQDFMLVNPFEEPFSSISALVVDPSCSGSGLVTRAGVDKTDSQAAEDQEALKERLKGLAEMQSQLVQHAMSFPSAQVVVYSTCSIHREENEEVVRAVLAAMGGEFAVARAVPQWPTRGVPTEGLDADVVDMLVRCDPDRDYTNGFFVARFERIAPPAAADVALRKEAVLTRQHEVSAMDEEASHHQQPQKQQSQHKQQKQEDGTAPPPRKKKRHKEHTEQTEQQGSVLAIPSIVRTGPPNAKKNNRRKKPGKPIRMR